MKLALKLGWLLLTMGLFLSSCDKETEKLEFGTNPAGQMVFQIRNNFPQEWNIQSNCNWSFQDGASWVHLSKKSGSGDDYIVVTVDNNETGVGRSAQFRVVLTNDSGKSAVLFRTVFQHGK